MEQLTYSNYTELVKLLPDERTVHQYLASQRWQDGEVTCPRTECGHERVSVFSDGIRYKCKKCQLKFTAKTNTFMEGSHLPTVKWLAAMNYILHKRGISSVQLAEELSITQKSAWYMGHRIRWALGFDPLNDDKMDGTVASDEAFIGGLNKFRHKDKKVKGNQGRAHIDKTPVLGIVQLEEREYIERPHKVIKDRVVKEKIVKRKAVFKAFVIEKTSARCIQPLIIEHVSQGSIFVTDEWEAYRGVGRNYQHEIVDHGRGQYVNDKGYTSNAVENRWGHLKPKLKATHRKVSRKHLQLYLHEDCFKFNHRELKVQGRIEAIWSAKGERLTYKKLIA